MSVSFRQGIRWPAALLLAALFLPVFFLTGCSKPVANVVSHSGMTMGTSFTVKWVSSDSSIDAELPSLINQVLVDVNNSMSTYQANSELTRINQLPAGSSVTVSAGLAEVLQRALEISQKSDGAFDVTVGPLVNLWGFGPDGRIIKAPADDEISTLMARVGYQYLDFDVQQATLLKQRDIYIDLSAIAKGYGVDRVARQLESKGITSYLVEVGGELRAKGLKPDGVSWKVAIEAPVIGDRQIQRIVAVNNVGIATSGDYRNYFEENGVRFSHTINPADGKPIRHRLASVTVLADDCASADALATAMMVMGPERAEAFASQQGVEALLIVKTDTGFTEIMTPGFSKFLVQ
ncbi:FAD:protein FMN transferase [Amphritea sp. HPY]|uniref:FAD:protein FMN transferase n=1 Tax=Amphritea sp. HPY TaxID=3421652 RepID=UPI003D7D870A